MKSNRACGHSLSVLVLLLGWLRGQRELLELIRSEVHNACLFETLKKVFQGLSDPLVAIFRTMSAEERRHATILEWCYRKRFGSLPADCEPHAFESKTLERGIHAGLHRLMQDQLAQQRRAARFSPKRVLGAILGLTNRIRGAFQS